MPGGASVGGPANAKIVVVALDGQPTLSWPSIDAAIRAVNQNRIESGRQKLVTPAIYVRLQAGWSAAEALEPVPRVDRRSVRRTPVRIGDIVYRNLRHASAATGISAAALRSRLHRAAAAGPAMDIGVDRRHHGSAPRCRHLRVRCPETGVEMRPAAYAKHSGLPKSTILRRWHQALAAGLDPQQAHDFVAFYGLIRSAAASSASSCRMVVGGRAAFGSWCGGSMRIRSWRLAAAPEWVRAGSERAFSQVQPTC